MDESALYPLGEFVSLESKKEEEPGEFVIVLRGRLKYFALVLKKLDSIHFTKADLEYWCGDSSPKDVE